MPTLIQFPCSSPFPTLSIFSAIGFVFLVHILYTRYHNGLNKIPGPFQASISSFWKFHVVWREKMPQENTLLHERFGPLVRIGPNHISASSSEAIQAIYRSKIGFTKSSIYSILQPHLEGADLHNVFSTQDPDFHAALKRTIGSLYTTTAVVKLEHHIDNCTRVFLSKMQEMIELQKPTGVDMSAWLQYYAFDSLGEINFSKRLGFLDTGTDIDGICELDHKQMMYFALMGQITTLEKFWSKLKSLAGRRRENPLFELSLQLVEERRKTPSGSKDMLASFLSLHEAVPERFSIRDVIAATYINVVTAHDVVAITLRAIVYYLAKDRNAQKRLQLEISDAASAGKLSTPARYAEIATLSYLLAVVNEALRIHPSTGLILERIVPTGGVTLHGRYIPEKTIIGVNCWVVNRDKAIFGDDANDFRPERWIENEPDIIQKMKMNMFTYSAGSRNCIGKNLAMMQLMKIIVEIYRNFDVKLADPKKEWRVSGGWLTRQTDMNMILEKRLDISIY